MGKKEGGKKKREGKKEETLFSICIVNSSPCLTQRIQRVSFQFPVSSFQFPVKGSNWNTEFPTSPSNLFSPLSLFLSLSFPLPLSPPSLRQSYARFFKSISFPSLTLSPYPHKVRLVSFPSLFHFSPPLSLPLPSPLFPLTPKAVEYPFLTLPDLKASKFPLTFPSLSGFPSYPISECCEN